MTPFERDEARVLNLYRIPSPPGTGRTLEVLVRPVSVFHETPWPGGLAVTLAMGSPEAAPAVDSRQLLNHSHRVVVGDGKSFPFRDGSFDMLILHRTLEDLYNLWSKHGDTSRVSQFVSSASRVLVSGGLVTGCVGNRNSIPYYVARFRALLGLKGLRSEDAPAIRQIFTRSSVKSLLEKAGLHDVSLFWLFPHDRSPSFLVEDDNWSARSFWLRDLKTRRQQLGGWSYFARRVALALGLNNLSCETIFFWGRKS